MPPAIPGKTTATIDHDNLPKRNRTRKQAVGSRDQAATHLKSRALVLHHAQYKRKRILAYLWLQVRGEMREMERNDGVAVNCVGEVA
jgi:hypothetical protein